MTLVILGDFNLDVLKRKPQENKWRLLLIVNRQLGSAQLCTCMALPWIWPLLIALQQMFGINVSSAHLDHSVIYLTI